MTAKNGGDVRALCQQDYDGYYGAFYVKEGLIITEDEYHIYRIIDT